MTKTRNNILITWMIALIMGAVFASCSKDNDMVVPEEEQHAIVFASDIAEEEQISRAGRGEVATRATTLGNNFLIYGYKYVDGSEQTVFDGYTVKYSEGSANTSADNTHGYYYVGGEQSIKYWDLAAADYHFWGLWQETTGLATFSAEHDVLTIHNVPLRAGDPAPTDNVLFSELYDRSPVSTDVVRLQFKRPYAKLRIQFYTSLPMRDDDIIELTDITFAPDPDASDPLVNKVYGKGDVVVTYPTTSGSCDGKAQETISVENLSEEKANLAFQDVTLTKDAGISSNTSVTAAVDDFGHQYYYPLPMGEKNPAFTMSVCIDGNSEMKTAVVPATFMQWRANFFYTYIFKITEAGKKIEFDGVKIDPWWYGGSQEEEWRNW